MRFTIKNKIITAIVLMTMVILAGVYVYLNNHLRDYTYTRIRSNLVHDLALSRSYVEQSLVDQKAPQVLDGLADRIGADLGMRVTIVSPSGKVWGDSEIGLPGLAAMDNHGWRAEVQQALKTGLGESRRFSTTLRREMLYMAVPFDLGQRQQGVLRLAIPLSEISIISNDLKRLLGISLAVAFIFTLVFGWMASSLIARPIKTMAAVATDMAGGNFKRRSTAKGHDEVADLGKAFNEMADQVQARISNEQESRARLEAVLLNMFEGVMVVDAHGQIQLMNQRLKGFLSVEKEPMHCKPLEVVRNIEIQEITDKVLGLAQGVESRELTLLFPEEKRLLVHATPIFYQAQIQGAVLVFHDITDLRHLERVRQDFVANVSHELRTPVATIKGYAETLIDGALDDKAHAQKFLNIILTDADRLARIIDDLLDLSRVESGRLELTCKRCPLRPLTNMVVTSLASTLEKEGIRLDNQIPDDCPAIKVDEILIGQVFQNLIENAIKYNKRGGVVTLVAKDSGAFVEVDVRDTGIGIPEDDIPRIFERFYRVDKAHSRQLGGTGLGLAIVKHIIQAHGGDIHLTSALGVGTTFCFTLPKV